MNTHPGRQCQSGLIPCIHQQRLGVIKWLSEIRTMWFLVKMDGRPSAKARLALLLFTTPSPQLSTLLVVICPALGAVN